MQISKCSRLLSVLALALAATHPAAATVVPELDPATAAGPIALGFISFVLLLDRKRSTR